MRLIKNEVVVDYRFFVLLPVKLLLMMIPWNVCHAVFDKIFWGWGGFRVIACSHNVAVFRNELPVLRVKDNNYC